MGTFFESEKDMVAKGEGWALHFIRWVSNLTAPMASRLREMGHSELGRCLYKGKYGRSSFHIPSLSIILA